MPNRVTTTITALILGVAAIGGVLTLNTLSAPSSAEEAPGSAGGVRPEALVHGPSAVVANNPQGDVTVIEFFDYQCPICRQVHPDVKRLAGEDDGVRIVHKHWPVFGAASIYAAKLALAARWQDRYEEVHDAFMNILGRLDHDRIREAAQAAGLDVDQAEKDLAQRADEVRAAFDEAEVQAHSLQLRGTPAFVIGNYLVPGGVDYATMRQIVDQIRKDRKEERK